MTAAPSFPAPQDPPASGDEVTAALLVIGDEILSGRTKDQNIGFIAENCTNIGIRLQEVRIVPDVEARITAAVNALRATYTYVFTTGGIGPTHDDVTADSIARAFGVSIGVDPRAVDVLLERYRPEELTDARLRMARVPEGAELIENAVSKAPGFMIGNVIVMAGIPAVMQAMFEAVKPRLKTGRKMLSRTLRVDAPEGRIAEPLRQCQLAYPSLSLGSYPFAEDGRFCTNLVVRGTDEALIEEALADLVARLKREGVVLGEGA